MISQDFFEELGKFLFALAKADGTIQQQEKAAVEKFISHELRKHKRFSEHPEYRELILTKLSFDNSINAGLSLESAHSTFSSFLKKYGTDIDSHLKNLATLLIHRTAQACKGINKGEEKIMKDVLILLETNHSKE